MSSFLQNIVADAEAVVEPVLASLSQTPTVQAIEQYTLTVVLAVELKQTSFRVGAYTVTAALNGTPTPLTLGSAFSAVENIISGKTGTFQSGDISLSIVPTATVVAAAAATPAA
jgi:hypothetical protein